MSLLRLSHAHTVPSPVAPSRPRAAGAFGRYTRRLLALAAFGVASLGFGVGAASAQQSDCCQVKFTSNCEDMDCANAVCATEASCCVSSWASVCPVLAQELCGVCADLPQIQVTEMSDFNDPEPEFTPVDLARSLMGFGVNLLEESVVFIGDYRAAGFFANAEDIIGFDEGIILSSGRVVDVVGPNIFQDMTTNFGTPGDDALDALANQQTYDAAILDFDFEVGPNADQIFFRYVFGSDEYNEYVYSVNDVFALFVNGVNCAVTPDSASDPGLPVAINTINNGQPGQPPTNPELYINNDPFNSDFTGTQVPPTSLHNTEMDGFTVVLTCRANVNPGAVNNLRLAIADATDEILDSWILIEGESVTTIPPECGDGLVEGTEQCDDGAFNGITCCNVDCTWAEDGDPCGGGGGVCVAEEVVPVLLEVDPDPAPVVCECPEAQGFYLNPETLICETACGDGIAAGNEQCDWGEANGTTTCGCQIDCTYPTAGLACGGAPAGACDAQNTCDGAGTCAENFAPAGSACGDASDTDCRDPDACDGAGVCLTNLEPDGTLCTSDGLFCTGVEACLEGVCVSPGDPCDAATQICVEDPGLCVDLDPIVIAEPEDGTLTNDPRPTISGTATPHATVEVYVGEVLIGTTTADADGAWSLDPESDLPEGEVTIRGVATLGDHVSEDSVSIVIDTTPPVIAIADPEDGSTRAPGPFVVSGTTEPGATVVVFIDGEAVGSTVADGEGNWSVTVEEELEDGEYVIVATAMDPAGNTADDQVMITIETPPADPCSDPALNDCHETAICVTLEDGYECVCEEGYEFDDEGACVDIDECAEGLDDCGEGATCVNEPGGYTCVCEEGYELDANNDCVDIDECAEGLDNCDENAICINEPGGFSCVCEEGYEGDGVTCVALPDPTAGYIVSGGGGCSGAHGGSSPAPLGLVFALGLALLVVRRRAHNQG